MASSRQSAHASNPAKNLALLRHLTGLCGGVWLCSGVRRERPAAAWSGSDSDETSASSEGEGPIGPPPVSPKSRIRMLDTRAAALSLW